LVYYCKLYDIITKGEIKMIIIGILLAGLLFSLVMLAILISSQNKEKKLRKMSLKEEEEFELLKPKVD
jgi:hypothetical protein